MTQSPAAGRRSFSLLSSLSPISSRSPFSSLSWVASTAMLCLVLLGLLFRLTAFVENRSIGTDEASLAGNVVTRSFSELVQPLSDDQGAPLGYLASLKASILILGRSDYALRAMSILPVDEAFTTRRIAVLGAVGALAIWFSHPAVFTLAASMLHLYPFGGYGGRLLLFVVPAIALSAAVGWRVVGADRSRVIAWTLAIAIFVPMLKIAVRQARGDTRDLRQAEEIRPLLLQMRREMQPGDHVYVFSGAKSPFALYTAFGVLPGNELHVTDGFVNLIAKKTAGVSEFEEELSGCSRSIDRLPAATSISPGSRGHCVRRT